MIKVWKSLYLVFKVLSFPYVGSTRLIRGNQEDTDETGGDGTRRRTLKMKIPSIVDSKEGESKVKPVLNIQYITVFAII